jgi:hypothetical protein
LSVKEIAMKLKHLFMINLFIAVPIGLSCVLIPGWTIRLYGLIPDDGNIWVTRLVGGSILGYASLMWFGRRSGSYKTRRAIALALFIQDIVGFAGSLEIQLSGNINYLGWPLNVLTYGFFALGYGFFYFIKPGKC